jgi:hypothetical protein
MKYCQQFLLFGLLLVTSYCTFASGFRINQEGRILGTLSEVTNSILFNTTNADAVVSAMQIFPVSNPWNECISNRPVLANSAAMIANIYTNVGSSHRYLELFQEMNFVLVPDEQMLVSNLFVDYPDESDLNGGISPYGLYPIPTNQPIEGWPTGTGTQTLLQWQTNNDGSDRHSIMVEPGAGRFFETWNALRTGTNWQAANGAIFDLNSNGLRPAGWTSGDAAGFPMFPALVRYEECERGMVEHACRLVVVKSRYGTYLYPATHFAAPSSNTGTNIPAMGQRLRLKADFPIPAGWTKEEKALVLGLKKYGAMVADNSSSFFSISITPDNRWSNAFDDLAGKLSITNFEVIQTTGPDEGPRSPGAPSAFAGASQTAFVGVPLTLAGAVSFSNTTPAIQWSVYSGPGTVAFGNAALTNTTATFSAAGNYILELSAADGVHAVAYDAVAITVGNGLAVTGGLNGTNLNLSWSGGAAPYVVQATSQLVTPAWVNVATSSIPAISLPMTNAAEFFRIQSP